ncbi:hypothetical protein V2J09_006946, partial [Rumex salicifolius]
DKLSSPLLERCLLSLSSISSSAFFVLITLLREREVDTEKRKRQRTFVGEIITLFPTSSSLQYSLCGPLREKKRELGFRSAFFFFCVRLVSSFLFPVAQFACKKRDPC